MLLLRIRCPHRYLLTRWLYIRVTCRAEMRIPISVGISAFAEVVLWAERLSPHSVCRVRIFVTIRIQNRNHVPSQLVHQTLIEGSNWKGEKKQISDELTSILSKGIKKVAIIHI